MDFLIAYAIIAGLWAFVALSTFAVVYSDGSSDESPDDRRLMARTARNFVLAPLWPIVVVPWLIGVLRAIIRVGFSKDAGR